MQVKPLPWGAAFYYKKGPHMRSLVRILLLTISLYLVLEQALLKVLPEEEAAAAAEPGDL